jgi:hypothetical protein
LPNDLPPDQSYGQRPIPDPTTLTTQQLVREIGSLQILLETRIEALEDVEDQKFFKVEQQFELVERQRVEQKKDTKDAVDAALTAQKEAVREQTAASERAIAKSEAATSKQLDQLSVTFTTEAASLRRELGEMKERLTGIEQQKIGAKDTSAGIYSMIGVAGILLGILIVVVNYATSH